MVTEDALRNNASTSDQKRVFGLPDGTVAILYHRAVEATAELQEIVFVHSHDGGKTWHGEIVIGTETPNATYTGILAPTGDLFVAYGRDAERDAAGAIKLARLIYDNASHGWRLGNEQRVVWDWPGRGASVPVLAFTGSKLWLAYRYYEGRSYTIYVQYADPNTQGDYQEANWSNRFALTPATEKPKIYASLVSHGAQLSALYTGGDAGVEWRRLIDPIGNPDKWRDPQTPLLILRDLVDEEGPEFRFTAISDLDGNIHLAFSSEGQFIGYSKYDGFEWSRLRQLSTNGVFGPSIASDGFNSWIFWNKTLTSGRTTVEKKRWNPEEGWERGSGSPWNQEYASNLPSILVFRSRGSSYSDITRYVAGQASFNGGLSIVQYLQRAGDTLFIGGAEKFNFLPLDARQTDLVDFAAIIEYWNGSDWVSLPESTIQLQTAIDGAIISPGPINFTPPDNWEVAQVNGSEGYYLRLVWDGIFASLAAVTFSSPPQVGNPITGAVQPDVVSSVWTEAAPGQDQGKLWYGALSTSEDYFVTLEGVEHTHEDVKIGEDATALLTIERPVSLPSGSPRQYFQVSLDKDQTHEFQLLDGQVRRVTLIETRLDYRSPQNVTVWATATVEVSGPGLQPERAEIPAAYFQAPVVLNGVRVFVEITRDFNDFRISGGGTNNDARLMLSDARYSLTSLYDYNYPFEGILWGLGPFDSYFQGLRGTISSHLHGAAYQQSMPSDTPVVAWHRGSLGLALRNTEWTASLDDTKDERSADWHQVSPLTGIDSTNAGGLIKPGIRIGKTMQLDAPFVQWGSGSNYDWAPVLAEWYVAQSSPVIRSYQKDWLVLGPISSEGILEPLSEAFIQNEATVSPREGDAGPNDLAWKRYEGIVPGVVNVAEAVSDYPNSGWASINGNQPFSVAYFATYAYAPAATEVTLNIGSSDAFKVWVNDKMALDNPTMVRVRRPSDWSVLPDTHKVPVLLQQGWNRVLIKLSQEHTDFAGPEMAQRAWQLTFRVSDRSGEPISYLTVNPDRRLLADSLSGYAILSSRPDAPLFSAARPPARRHEWPEKADMVVGESFTYTLLDGSQRTLKLLSYDIVIPRHKVTARIEVSGDGKVETHTLEVALAGVPVSLNGLRVYAYAWKEANDFGFEQVGLTGDFPLTSGKDVGFAVSDASAPMFPDIQNYTYPFDIPLHAGADLQSWLEPAGDFDSNAWAHAGYDVRAPDDAYLVAMRDGIIWHNKPNNNDPQSLGQGTAWLATGNGDKFDDPQTWLFTHVLTGSALVPSGTFVKKGTRIANGGSHVGTVNSFDFGGWLFTSEVWNYEHKNDFPVPRYWLVLGPYDGNMSSSHIGANERGDLPADILPREGAPDLRGLKNWKFADNFGNGVVAFNELLSLSPFSGYPDRWPTNSVAYAATYIFSANDHTTDGMVHLMYGANQVSKVWVNGKAIAETTNRSGGFIKVDEFDTVLPLKRGWNVLIVKSSTGSSSAVWRFAPKIGDAKGNKIPGVEFSTRDMNLRVTSVEGNSISVAWSAPDFHGTFVESYRLDVALDEGFKDLVIKDRDIGRVTSYRIDRLDTGKRYFIRVKPFNSELGGTVYWHHVDTASAVSGQGVASSGPVTPPASGGSDPTPPASQPPSIAFPEGSFFVNFDVDAAVEVNPFTGKMRGVATNNWNWLENGLMEPLQKRSSIIEATSYLRPGVIRFAGGLWANRVGWDRNGIAPADGSWTFTDSTTGNQFHYTHAYSMEMVDSFADFAAKLGAEAIVQVNICDNNSAMWVDMLRYANVEKGYDFTYWELGNEQSLESCDLDPESYADRFDAYQVALKAVDPTIKIIGPVTHNPAEIAWFDTLVDRVGDNLDVASWHWYQLTEWTQNTSSYSYQGGSLEALLAYDGAVGIGCHTGFGCAERGDSIEGGRLSLWMHRRGIAEQMMETIDKRYRSLNPNLETAITEFGVHAANHELPLNSSHMAAVWLADMLPRWAYNGLDMVTYYSLEDGGAYGGNSRGLLGIWDDENTGIIDVRPIYYTVFMFAQYFGDMLVQSSTNDTKQQAVAWASVDSLEDGSLKLMLVNMHDAPAVANINVKNFNPVTGYAFKLASTNPLSMEDPFAYTNHNSTINGARIPDFNIGNPQAFQRAITGIVPESVKVSERFIYTLPPYSVVSLILRNFDGPPPSASPAVIR